MKSSKKYLDTNEKYGPQHPILHNYKYYAFEYSGEGPISGEDPPKKEIACGSGYSYTKDGYKNSRPCEAKWQEGEKKLLMYKRYQTAVEILKTFKEKLKELWILVVKHFPNELEERSNYKLEFVKLYNLGTNDSLLSLEKNELNFNQEEYEKKVKELGGTFLKLKIDSIIENKDISTEEEEEKEKNLNDRLKKSHTGGVLLEFNELVKKVKADSPGDGQKFIEQYFKENNIDKMFEDYSKKVKDAEDDWNKIYKNWMDNYYAPVDWKIYSYHYQPMFMSYQFPKDFPWYQDQFEKYMVTRIHHKNEDFVYDIRWVRSGRRIPSRDHIDRQDTNKDVIDAKDEYEKKVKANEFKTYEKYSKDDYEEKYNLTLKKNLDEEKNVKVWEEGLLDKYKQLGISDWVSNGQVFPPEVHTLTLPVPRWATEVNLFNLKNVIKKTFRNFVVHEKYKIGVETTHITND